MKLQILLLALIVAALSSCSTAYKTGQTPDDVYFSPAPPQDEYVRTNKDERRYQSLDEYYDDRFLRMRVQNRNRWSALDDYYFNNPYAYNYYGYSNNWNNPWNSYWTWNNYYNPYCNPGGGVIIKNPTSYTRPPSKPIAFNSGGYLGNNNNQSAGVKRNTGYYNNNYNTGGTRYNNTNNSGSSRNYSNSHSNSGYNSSSSYTPSSSTPSRSYTPSSSSSGSSSSSSGSSSSSSGSSVPPSRPPR
jgi:hypothetical protein